MSAIVRVDGLVVEHSVRTGPLRRQRVRAVDGVDLALARGRRRGAVEATDRGRGRLLLAGGGAEGLRAHL
ncbi:hypothetical protein AB0H81_40420, partial [Nonomuraea sp. NPDC050691]